MLRPQWSKEELERFYEAYRKCDKDWRKVVGMIRNKSLEMVEALYNMNKEGSDSERKSNDVSRTSCRPQKHARGKYRLMSKGSDGPFPDLLQFQSASSSYASMSLLKKKRTGVTSAADEGDHVAALALAEASQKGGSPQVSRIPGRRGDHLRCSPARTGERKEDTESEMADSKTIRGFDVDYPEGSLGSWEAENGDFTKDVGYLMDTGCASSYGARQKVKKLQGMGSKAAQNENDHFDDDREACSGTEEGLNIRKINDDSDMER